MGGDDILDIEQRQDRIIREFKVFDDWMDKYKHIIQLGTQLKPLSPENKNDSNLVKGCQSQVWLVASYDNGQVKFEADSDAAITKGLVALVVRLYTNQSPEQILKTQPRFIHEIGMTEHLSPTRANGLASMVKQMKIYAMAFASKHTN
jgi:cysteine desulfuration protein SufE